MTTFPAQYLEVLKIAQELGADIGDRMILLEQNAGEKTPAQKWATKPTAKKEGAINA